MKCPKCGYLGFEPTDRCRNCGYDFSLSEAPPEPDLSLHDEAAGASRAADFDLGGARTASPPALDLDRIFGAEAPTTEAPAGPPDDRGPRAPRRVAPPAPLDPPRASTVSSELPFDDLPSMTSPRPARQPLGVRRATPDTPRSRPRTTRPVRLDAPLDLDLTAPGAAETAEAGTGDVALVAASVAARLLADAIDMALLLAIGAVVVVLTLRLVGLSLSSADLRMLPPAPLAGFFIVLWLTYLTTFTVAGGQTIGKMLMRVRVIGDDGRPVDLPGALLRAIGSLLVLLTLGLAYVPVLVTADRRGVHDRLAGTRVVVA